MKVNVLGVKRVEGNAKESGNPFDICRLICAVPIESGSFGKVRIDGAGFETAEMELDPASIPTFKAVKFPAELELTTDQKFHRGEFKTFVTGILKQNPLKAAG